jgi:pantoate--beta-alanine ligase
MTLEVARTVGEFRAACEGARKIGRLGLVPTMGALHRGHVALIVEARKHAETVAVTIFVNPTQFGPKEDLARYPRDLEGDLEKCRGAGASLVFAPQVAEMYPEGERTRVRVSELTEHLCGASRPGHFEGVATIVTKLFAATGPCVAVFGRKDYQQLKVIERMTLDLLLPVEIVAHETVRESDGLALSSRNAYLSDAERRQALSIPRALGAALSRFGGGERDAGALRKPVEKALAAAGLRVDYVTLADSERLVPIADEARAPARALLAVAAFAGATRLIDNVVLGEQVSLLGVGGGET